MSTLERAIAIALEAHAGQRDKAGDPYILHPLRVMLGVTTSDERVVAVLHDVVEDSTWTLDDLREEGFIEEIVQAVDALSHREGESYDDFVRRSGACPLARRVKFADLEDNMNLSRICGPTEGDHTRVERYRRALSILEAM
jgi:(p)ppGpp synthase/HD superfamily hydrolase